MSWFANAKKASEAASQNKLGPAAGATGAAGISPAPSSAPGPNPASPAATGSSSDKRTNSAILRIQKEIVDLITESPAYRVVFPSKDDLLSFRVWMTPQEGYWKGGKFDFSVAVPLGYPVDPPKVHCNTSIYHPNIDTDGNVCLNILRADWKPVLGIQHLLFGLQLLFDDPNPDDPLNREAAELLRKDKQSFARMAQRGIRGSHW